MEDFFKHMKTKTRTKNGKAATGKSNLPDKYAASSVGFILAVCRTAFKYALKRKYYPKYRGNPCDELPIDPMRKTKTRRPEPFSDAQEAAFYAACNDWQFGIFFTLATVGLRRNELRYLLISDVDFDRGVVHIRSKPELLWSTKNKKDRTIPIFPLWGKILRECIGSSKEGFIFLH